jgi:hypothetical protein
MQIFPTKGFLKSWYDKYFAAFYFSGALKARHVCRAGKHRFSTNMSALRASGTKFQFRALQTFRPMDLAEQNFPFLDIRPVSIMQFTHV